MPKPATRPDTPYPAHKESASAVGTPSKYNEAIAT